MRQWCVWAMFIMGGVCLLGGQWRRTALVGRLDPLHMAPFGGHAFASDISALSLQGPSDSNSLNASELILTEDGMPLPLAHEAHERIRNEGAGRFTHWADAVYFSASDNSDPRSNGRIYELRRSAPILEILVVKSFRVRSDRLVSWLTMFVWAIMGIWVLFLMPLSRVPAARRSDWVATQTVPTLAMLGLIVSVGVILHRNFLDVTTRTACAFHVLIAGSLLLGLLMKSFVCWLKERRSKLLCELPYLVRSVRITTNIMVAICSGLLATESLARAWPIVDSYSINPGIHFFWPDWFVGHNKVGYSDRPICPKQGLRVLVLGDSYAEGAGVSRSQRFADQLQRLMQQSDPNADVYCSGHCGLDTFDEANIVIVQFPVGVVFAHRLVERGCERCAADKTAVV